MQPNQIADRGNDTYAHIPPPTLCQSAIYMYIVHVYMYIVHVYTCRSTLLYIHAGRNRSTVVNPRRACAARVTVVACVCVCVCVCVCQLINISPLERLFVLKAIPRTQRTTKVKKIVAFCLKLLRCRDPALSTLVSIVRSAIFYSAEDAHAFYI